MSSRFEDLYRKLRSKAERVKRRINELKDAPPPAPLGSRPEKPTGTTNVGLRRRWVQVRTSEPDRIVTVSTIKDTVGNVERFVQRTLSSGVDHMIIFMDAEQPMVRAVLESHPHITVVQTNSEYWHGDRPAMVVDRQMVNANVACAALASNPSVRWLFHIDGDEALAFDRERLLALGARAVRFQTLEAVARRTWRNREPRLFKKVPDSGELHAMAALGLIDTPNVNSFFRGHSLGRSGVQPAEGIRFRLHTVYELPDQNIEAVLQPDMHLLRYESCCLAEFLDRWRHYDPEKADLRPFEDERLGAAFHIVANHPGISEDERRRHLGNLFDSHVADDLGPLRKFDLLVRNPLRRVLPRPLPGDEVGHIESEIEALCGIDKTEFRSTLLEGIERTAS